MTEPEQHPGRDWRRLIERKKVAMPSEQAPKDVNHTIDRHLTRATSSKVRLGRYIELMHEAKQLVLDFINGIGVWLFLGSAILGAGVGSGVLIAGIPLKLAVAYGIVGVTVIFATGLFTIRRMISRTFKNLIQNAQQDLATLPAANRPEDDGK